MCIWSGDWLPPSHSLVLQQAGNPADGPGVDRVEIWTCPTACTGSNATFRGVATYGLSRPDVVALTGASRFANSGFSCTLTGLAGGPYQVQVRMRSAFYGSSWNTTSVTVTVPTGQPHMAIESPAPNAGVAQPFSVNGWAIDAGAPSGVGVDQVHVWANKDPGSGTASAFWGSATLGGSRPTVGQTYGSQFTNSGYTLSVTGQPPGWYVGGVFAHSTVTGVWQATAMNLYVDIPTVVLTIDRQGAGTGGVSAARLSCPGGSSTQAVPCGASYTQGTVVTLTAVPDLGSAFAGWGGACTGSGACQVTLTTVRFVTATFTAAPTSTTVAKYYHTDAIGSVRAITDEAGATVIRHDYLPFGEDTQPLAGDPMRFGGKELDAESAQEYFGARYYRNIFGRFGTPDPVGGSLTNPQTWNGYGYAGNNPLRFTDPLGLTWVCLDGPSGEAPFCYEYVLVTADGGGGGKDQPLPSWWTSASDIGCNSFWAFMNPFCRLGGDSGTGGGGGGDGSGGNGGGSGGGVGGGNGGGAQDTCDAFCEVISEAGKTAGEGVTAALLVPVASAASSAAAGAAALAAPTVAQAVGAVGTLGTNVGYQLINRSDSILDLIQSFAPLPTMPDTFAGLLGYYSQSVSTSSTWLRDLSETLTGIHRGAKGAVEASADRYRPHSSKPWP